MIADLWFKDAVIYSVDVETFMDADGDGVVLGPTGARTLRLPLAACRRPQPRAHADA